MREKREIANRRTEQFDHLRHSYFQYVRHDFRGAGSECWNDCLFESGCMFCFLFLKVFFEEGKGIYFANKRNCAGVLGYLCRGH